VAAGPGRGLPAHPLPAVGLDLQVPPPDLSTPPPVSPQRIFRNVTTSDDPIMRKLAADGAGRVFATDSVLSALMCAKSSVYRWGGGLGG
jgi:hypothetical protein